MIDSMESANSGNGNGLKNWTHKSENQAHDNKKANVLLEIDHDEEEVKRKNLE